MEDFKNYFQKVAESAQFLKSKIGQLPQLIIVLSGGLDPFVELIEQPQNLCSNDIPHFPRARVKGHSGELVFGELKGLPAVVLKGRHHYYEGLTAQEIVFPYFVLRELGAQYLFTTNAVGAVNLNFKVGDIVLVKDHINMMGDNPLRGLSVQRGEDQFPTLQQAYDPRLIAVSKQVAKRQKLKLKSGVLLGCTGPSYETPAEIKAFRRLGADCVGMSTVFEVITARFLKMKVLTFSIVTNLAADRHQGVMNHDEVLKVMEKTEAKMIKLLQGVIGSLT